MDSEKSLGATTHILRTLLNCYILAVRFLSDSIYYSNNIAVCT